jgi:putative addiction module killer protein
MEARERNVLSYKTPSGVFPFRIWRDSFSDEDVLAAIYARTTRFSAGNFGDSEPVGNGVSESKINLGPGYRVYYGIDGGDVILLCGGDKSTQDADTIRAREYWKDYKERRGDESSRGRKKRSPDAPC